jgi:hypothetical protein
MALLQSQLEEEGADPDIEELAVEEPDASSPE